MGSVAISTQLALLWPRVDPSIRSAWAKLPNKPNAADMPLIGVLPGESRPDYEALGNRTATGSLYVEVRTYHNILLVGALGTGGPGELPDLCKPILDAWRDYFLERPMLSDLAAVPPIPQLKNIWLTTPLDDTGVQGISWAGMDYVGAIMQLEIQEVKQYAHAAGE